MKDFHEKDTPVTFSGLNQEEVQKNRLLFGKNSLKDSNKKGYLALLVEVLTEPMFLLLVAASSLYFFWVISQKALLCWRPWCW